MGKYLDIKNLSNKDKNKLFSFLNELLIDKKNENLILKRSDLIDVFSIKLEKRVLENNNVNVFIIEYIDTIDEENKRQIAIEKLLNNDMTSSLYNKNYQKAITGSEIQINDILNNQITIVKDTVFDITIREIQNSFKSIKANKHIIAITGSSNVQYKFEEGEQLINKYLTLIYTYNVNKTKIQSLFLDFSVLRDKIKVEFLELKQILDFVDDNSIDTSIGNDVTYLEIEKFEQKVDTEYSKLKNRLQYFNRIVDGKIENVANNLISNLESKFKSYSNSKDFNSKKIKNDAIGVAADLALDLAISTYKTRQESKKTIAYLEQDIEIIRNTFTIDVSNLLDDFYRLFEIYSDIKENYIPNAITFYNVLSQNKKTELKELYEFVEHYELQPLWEKRKLLLSKIKFLNIEIDQTLKIVDNKQEAFTKIKNNNEYKISKNNSLIDTLNFKPSFIDLILSFGMYNFVFNNFLKEKINHQIENHESENVILKTQIIKLKNDLEACIDYHQQIKTDKNTLEESLTLLNKEILQKVSRIKTQLNINFYKEKISFLEEHFNNILRIDIDNELKTPEKYSESLKIISNYKIQPTKDLQDFEYKGNYVKLYSLIKSIKSKTIENLEDKIITIKGIEFLEIDESKLQNIEEEYIKKTLSILNKVKDLQLGNDTLDNMLNAETSRFINSTIKKHTQEISHLYNYENHISKATTLLMDYFKDLNEILKTKEITEFYMQLNAHNLNELSDRKLQLDERLKNKYQKNIPNEFNEDNF